MTKLIKTTAADNTNTELEKALVAIIGNAEQQEATAREERMRAEAALKLVRGTRDVAPQAIAAREAAPAPARSWPGGNGPTFRTMPAREMLPLDHAPERESGEKACIGSVTTPTLRKSTPQ